MSASNIAGTNIIVEDENEDVPSTQNPNNPSTPSVFEGRKIAELVQSYYTKSAKAVVKEPIKPNEQELPLEIQKILALDESLFDLMRHKQSFLHYFGSDFSRFVNSDAQSQYMDLGEKQAIENKMKNYVCFNAFFFPKDVLYQKSVLEIHHSQSVEKTQILHFLVAELLREQEQPNSSDKTIAPQILYFDNTQSLDFIQLKFMIKEKLLQQLYLSTRHEMDSSSQWIENYAESSSEECLNKLHVIQSKTQLEFCVNIRSLKHILTSQKAIRVVIIDSINAFYIDNESNAQAASAAFAQYDIKNTPSKPVGNYEGESSVKIAKKKKKPMPSIKGNISKQLEWLVREYLEEIYKKFTRVAFIQTRRDYYKVRNLIGLDDQSTSLFRANPELIQLLEQDDIDINAQTYKNQMEFEFSNIYLLSLDNFSTPALEKALELLRPEPPAEPLFQHPGKVSVVIKKNHVKSEQQHDEMSSEMEEDLAEANKFRQYAYVMNFYTFINGDFKSLSDNTYYFS